MRPVARRGHPTASQSLPDMTPMVDVVMVILIFFMASSALVGPELLLRARVASEAVAADAAPLISAAALVVRLEQGPDAARATGLGLRGSSVVGLLARIESRAADLRRGDIPIIVEAQPEVGYQQVVDVIAALERAGVRDVGVR